MKAKRLIEVAMPIKEVSAESQRDKAIRHGHISTLHLWWARRPLPTCRAAVFASLVPDPLDNNCPVAFQDAVKELLVNQDWNKVLYRPYDDIPYTAAIDKMEDNGRTRLLMFIGKFSDIAQREYKSGKTPVPKTMLSDGSLIKWENRTNEKVLRIARELIWIAYNAEKEPSTPYKQLDKQFSSLYDAILNSQEELYSIPDRHIKTEKVSKAEKKLSEAIHEFSQTMPMVFDPFSGGGAIPLEAARLGCRSFGNDLNPVAYVIEKGSAEFPQKYGKTIRYSVDEFIKLYGNTGVELASSKGIMVIDGYYEVPNRLAFDVEYYASQLFEKVKKEISYLYPKDDYGRVPAAYIWARTAKCSNPSCGADVPLLRSFYLANSKQNRIYLNPIVNGREISFEIQKGTYSIKEWNNRGNLTCPCCGNVTSIDQIKEQSKTKKLSERLVAVISESSKGRVYSVPQKDYAEKLKVDAKDVVRPTEKMPVTYGQAFPSCTWGYEEWGQLFSDRQLVALTSIVNNINALKASFPNDEYYKAIITYLAFLVDKETDYYNSFCTWHVSRETIGHLFSRQAIPMVFDFAETNLLADSSGSFKNMIAWVVEYIESESPTPFACTFNNASSGEKAQFKAKEISAVVTDPPYYDAIGYADCSDFFYVWLKQTLGDIYPINFSMPQTPKTEECTALKCHHDNDDAKARKHFEDKLTAIFDAIELQTSDIVCIMYAHQSTEAWTTLCNSILDARMNITGSWALDTEMAAGLKTEKAYLESSVTVSCKPSERKGVADYKEVRNAIHARVENEVNYLYSMGFRGADLLTACFGQAVSEFGKYRIVEKADGSEVTVAELLEMAKNSAFNALLKGVQGDDFTKFYIGWLQMNGMGETDFDDATKFTRVGMSVNVSEIFAKRLLIRDGKKQHLATAEEHLGNTTTLGTHPEDSLIDQVHRAMLAYEKGDRHILLTLLHNVGADDQNAPFWRLVASLKELLPEGKDLKAIEGLMGNSDNLRQESREVDQHKPEQMTFDFGSDFNNDFK